MMSTNATSNNDNNNNSNTNNYIYVNSVSHISVRRNHLNGIDQNVIFFILLAMKFIDMKTFHSLRSMDEGNGLGVAIFVYFQNYFWTIKRYIMMLTRLCFIACVYEMNTVRI